MILNCKWRKRQGMTTEQGLGILADPVADVNRAALVCEGGWGDWMHLYRPPPAELSAIR